MAYGHVQYEVKMVPASASTANTIIQPTVGGAVPGLVGIPLNVTYNPTAIGSGVYQPLTTPHKIDRIGVRLSANLTDAQALVFWKRIEGGATGWVTGAPNYNPTGEYFRFTVPTTAATGKSYIKTPTAHYYVAPGETLCVGVSTAVADILAHVGLLVSPVWEEPVNVTGSVRVS